MGKDFFDEDLVSTGEVSGESLVGDQETGQEPTGKEHWKRDRQSAPVSDLPLGRLVQEKRQLDGHVASAVHEMEQLERRQHELGHRKERLEGLARKQDEYEREKREIIEKLDRSIILMEKDEIQAARMADLLREIRANFKETLEEVKSIDEESWPADDFEEELDRAVVRVEEATMLCKKGINRVEAAGWKKGDWSKREAVVSAETPAYPSSPKGLWYWLKAGFFFSLPLLILISALFIVYLVLMGIL